MTSISNEFLKKKKINLALLVLLIIFHLFHLVIYEMVVTDMWKLTMLQLNIILGAIAFALIFVCILVLKNFIKKKWMFIGYVALFLLCGIFQIAYLNKSIYETTTLRHSLYMLSVGISVFIFCTILIIVIKDIFTEKHDLTYSLIGAANIFLAIIVTFGYVISLIFLANPNWVPNAVTVNDINNACFIISSYSVAGIDFPFTVPKIVQNIMTFQSIIMHLYAVMIVGRLLSR